MSVYASDDFLTSNARWRQASILYEVTGEYLFLIRPLVKMRADVVVEGIGSGLAYISVLVV